MNARLILLAMLAGPVPAYAQLLGDTVNAQKCAAAVAGDVDGDVILHCGMSRAELNAFANRLVDLLDQRGAARDAEAAGITRFALIALARRIAPNVETADQALIELDRAVEVAIGVQHRGQSAADQEGFVDKVMADLARLSAAGEYDDAAILAEDAYAQWEREEAERRAKANAEGIKLLTAGLEQDLLRYAPTAAARKIARRAGLEVEPLKERYHALRSEQEVWFNRGEKRGVELDLLVSIALAREVIALADTARMRAAALDDLGLALLRLGERRTGTADLREAVNVLERALQARNRSSDPKAWAGTQVNLGAAQRILGARTTDAVLFEKAVGSYRQALNVLSKDDARRWGAAQNNLGIALQALGQRDPTGRRFEEAIAAYKAALGVQAREADPHFWGVVQNNLGGTYLALGQRHRDAEALRQALTAFEAALEVRVRPDAPLEWAMTQMNLATAATTLGDVTGDVTALEKAVAALKSSLQVYTREALPVQWVAVQVNLGSALRSLGQFMADEGQVQESLIAYQNALAELKREDDPMNWAMTQGNMGNTLQLLAHVNPASDYAEQAVTALETSVSVLTRDRTPFLWAQMQNNLGNALRVLGESRRDTARLREADAAMVAAQSVWTRDASPVAWGVAEVNRSIVSLVLYDQTGDPAMLEASEAQAQTALSIFRRHNSPAYIQLAQQQLAFIADRRR